MNKLVVLGAGGLAAGAVALFGAGVATSEPDLTVYNVIGEPYAKAVAILRAQGVRTTFGGSVGSDVPQAQCIVNSEKVLAAGKIQLMLDCTAESQPEKPAATSVANSPSGGTQSPGAGNRPTPGAPGVVTVIPTQVG